MFRSFTVALTAAACAMLSGAISTPARASDEGCILDHCADREPATEAEANRSEPGIRGPAASAGDFDFYVLALSWSASFCELESRQRRRAQCESGAGEGFVVHGLWPQRERGYATDCPGPTSPSRMALERAAGVYPDEGLARHEWRKHGTCSGKSPSDYFADVKRAKESVIIPQPFQNPSDPQTFSPIDIQRAFIAANPRLRPGMLAVTCRAGALQEVRICFSKDLREFRACPEVARQACRTREITVPPPL